MSTLRNLHNKSMNKLMNIQKTIKAKRNRKVVNNNVSTAKEFNTMDVNRNRAISKQVKKLANNINLPISPPTCSGTSFQCSIAGSGKTRITNTNLYPANYDMLATPIQEGGLTGNTHSIPVVLNWNNSGIETPYTKQSLKNTLGFENFQ